MAEHRVRQPSPPFPEGADVALDFLPEEERDGQETAGLVRANGRCALSLAGEVSEVAFRRQAFERRRAELGGLDVLVHDAAVLGHRSGVRDISVEEWQRTVAAASEERRVFLPVRWLLGARADIACLVGSVAISYALLFLWRGGVLSTMQLVLIWIFGLHGTHFYGTMSRTYLDRTEWRERGPVLRRAFGWFLVGPLLVGLGLLVERMTGYRDVVLVFFFLAALWAYQHVIKQHFGFVALYRAKHRQFDKAGLTFFKRYLLVSLWAPALAVLVRSLNWFEQIPFAMVWARNAGFERADQVTTGIAHGALAAFWAAQVVFLGWAVVQVARGRALNLPALLIVLAAVPLSYIVSMTCLAASAAGPPGNFEAYAFVPLVTAYHNIQYHTLIWTYNRHKYGGIAPAKARARFGWAGVLNRSLWVYAACGLAFTLVTIGLEQYSIYDLAAVARGTYAGEILAAGIWGFSFLHYYLDGHIWHVRSDANLRRVLGFPEPSV